MAQRGDRGCCKSAKIQPHTQPAQQCAIRVNNKATPRAIACGPVSDTAATSCQWLRKLWPRKAKVRPKIPQRSKGLLCLNTNFSGTQVS